MIHSTLRLQFHRGFTFDDALQHVDYYARLGVSHLYASPITAAEPGSTHGYDVVDYNTVNPELGGEAALRKLVAALRERRLGLIVDFVPNHMGVGGGQHNAWWRDILEWGRHSHYARFFDVDWHSPDPALRGKMLAPYLGESYGEALEGGKLTLGFDATSGRLSIHYYDNRFPVCPCDYPFVLSATPALAEHAAQFETAAEAINQDAAQAACAALCRTVGTPDGRQAMDHALARFDPQSVEGRNLLHRLLERQHYRLAWWRTAADEVNWRRFFDISTLAGVKAERPEVFEASHALILRLYEEGLIDGIRLDHVDGLAEPREYCQRLSARLKELHARRPAALQGEAPYLVIEKILGRGEAMREDWQVDGTTGYDFMNDVGALLHDPAGAAPLGELWHQLSGRAADFGEEMLPAKRKILAENLAAELDRVTRALHRFARDNPRTRDFSCTAIRRVLSEIVVHFPVYRIYPVDGVRSQEDEKWFAQAREGARRSLRRADHALLDVIDQWLGAADSRATFASLAQRRAALGLFSQLTSPVAAKSVEDTACYRYGRLLSRNEVGADPDDFAMLPAAFHAANQARAQHFPRAMLTTATHDHKRGEDVRARLAVLSELPDWWASTVRRWSTLNAPLRRGGERDADTAWTPGPGIEAMLYQMLLASWPLSLRADDSQGVQAFTERIGAWLEKAMREAKLDTDWFAPNEDYEQRSQAFLRDILAPERATGFLAALVEAVQQIAAAGALNGLQQTVLRLSAPGVPDLYQGTEYWDESLVDPDNRRPVDYARRAETLGQAAPAALLDAWRDGRLKQAVIHRALQARQRYPELFVGGDYLPLEIEGPAADSALAFARRAGRRSLIVVVSRLAARRLAVGARAAPAAARPLIDPAQWQDTALKLPQDLAGRRWHDIFAAQDAMPLSADDASRLPLGGVLDSLCVAMLLDARD